MLKNKRTWDLIGVILGIVILIAGIAFMKSPPESYSTTSTDYATFGGDFYTYEYKATRAAASNAAVTANNIRELGATMAKCFGFLFVAIGSLTTVYYGKKYFTAYAEPVTVVPASISVPEVTADSEIVSDEEIVSDDEIDA